MLYLLGALALTPCKVGYKLLIINIVSSETDLSTKFQRYSANI